jgi:hypothetical protein
VSESRSDELPDYRKEKGMSHLTPEEIFQIIDSTIANGEKTRLLSHLDSCARCRREIDSQRGLEKAARTAPLASPSHEFTSSVMKRVAPAMKKSLVTKVVDNLANILAMALVLSVLFYALNVQKASTGTSEPSFVTRTLAVYTEYYGKARDYLKQEIPPASTAKERSPETIKIVLMAVVSLVILVGVDRFLLRRVIRLQR